MSSIVALASQSIGSEAVRLLLSIAARAATRSEVRREQRRLADALVVMGA